MQRGNGKAYEESFYRSLQRKRRNGTDRPDEIMSPKEKLDKAFVKGFNTPTDKISPEAKEFAASMGISPGLFGEQQKKIQRGIDDAIMNIRGKANSIIEMPTGGMGLMDMEEIQIQIKTVQVLKSLKNCLETVTELVGEQERVYEYGGNSR